MIRADVPPADYAAAPRLLPMPTPAAAFILHAAPREDFTRRHAACARYAMRRLF